jgi:dTDP-glucose pyrophosphorylase
MVNIVIPMAGEGRRFKSAGYKKPKPFIDVNGKPMITRVLDNLNMPNARFILIARSEHLAAEPEVSAELEKNYDCRFITVDKLTEGMACTILFAREFINNDNPLLLANSDQLVDITIADFVEDCLSGQMDGSIMTFTDRERNPKWSFVKMTNDGFVSKVKEKEAISEHATVGIYFYSKGKDFVNSALDMIVNNDRTNNEFYTCPTYNYAIRSGKNIGIFNIDQDKMHGLGTPSDLDKYLARFI